MRKVNRLAAVCVLLAVTAICVVIMAGRKEAPEEPVQEIEWEDPQETDKIEAALIASANPVGACKVTFYCNEAYEHICGSGDGLTAMGTPIIPGVSVAVDPKVIPLGSTVYMDFGDGALLEFLAQDVGGWVNGNHVDLAVDSHSTAEEFGVKSAMVWWKNKGGE